jgi:hypothetical protein
MSGELEIAAIRTELSRSFRSPNPSCRFFTSTRTLFDRGPKCRFRQAFSLPDAPPRAIEHCLESRQAPKHQSFQVVVIVWNE